MNKPLRGAGSKRRRTLVSALAPVLLAVVTIASAHGAEVVGRIVDNVEARVFEGAGVEFRTSAGTVQKALTDAYGFFRISNINPGPYVLEVSLPDGRDFTARLLVARGSRTQFLELDYARAVPPGDDDDY